MITFFLWNFFSAYLISQFIYLFTELFIQKLWPFCMLQFLEDEEEEFYLLRFYYLLQIMQTLKILWITISLMTISTFIRVHKLSIFTRNSSIKILNSCMLHENIWLDLVIFIIIIIAITAISLFIDAIHLPGN